MTTTVKQVFGALAALVLSSTAAVADATFNGITYVDLTTDGAGTASSTNAAYSGYSMPGCFDNSWADSADRGMCGYTTTYPAMYVDYAFNTATTVNAYSVRNAGTGGSNQTTRAPNTWTFEGSDDGVTWTQLDARTNETGWASAEIRLYKFVNTHAYTQYRYSCTVINGGNCFQVHEIEFYNTTAPLVTSSFSKKLVFTVAGHVGSEDLKHFPVLVRLSTAINGFDYADCGTDGAGLRFADADGNLLHHEIDTWNTAGESLVWVDLPHCRANETFTLYLAADDPAALQTVYPTEVWDNAGVPAVWHMNPRHDFGGRSRRQPIRRHVRRRLEHRRQHSLVRLRRGREGRLRRVGGSRRGRFGHRALRLLDRQHLADLDVDGLVLHVEALQRHHGAAHGHDGRRRDGLVPGRRGVGERRHQALLQRRTRRHVHGQHPGEPQRLPHRRQEHERRQPLECASTARRSRPNTSLLRIRPSRPRAS